MENPPPKSGRKKAHKHKLFALVDVQMALGQTPGCPRVNRAKKFMCSPRNTGKILLSLVNRRVVPGLSRISKSLCVQSLCAFFLPYKKQNLRKVLDKLTFPRKEKGT